jgi:hypothetical protein
LRRVAHFPSGVNSLRDPSTAPNPQVCWGVPSSFAAKDAGTPRPFRRAPRYSRGGSVAMWPGPAGAPRSTGTISHIGGSLRNGLLGSARPEFGELVTPRHRPRRGRTRAVAMSPAPRGCVMSFGEAKRRPFRMGPRYELERPCGQESRPRRGPTVRELQARRLGGP